MAWRAGSSWHWIRAKPGRQNQRLEWWGEVTSEQWAVWAGTQPVEATAALPSHTASLPPWPRGPTHPGPGHHSPEWDHLQVSLHMEEGPGDLVHVANLAPDLGHQHAPDEGNINFIIRSVRPWNFSWINCNFRLNWLNWKELSLSLQY